MPIVAMFPIAMCPICHGYKEADMGTKGSLDADQGRKVVIGRMELRIGRL